MKTLLSALSLLITITGCSIKDTDETEVKVAKHVANAPIYAVGAIGAAGTAVVGFLGGGIAYGLSKTGDAISGSEMYWGETYRGKQTEEALDNNVSFAKFYTDNNFALYKNSENESFMLLKETDDFIQSSNPRFEKRTAIARYEKRPHLNIKKYRLPDGIGEDLIYEKIKKDRFGNPLFFGDSILLEANQFRNGLFLTLKADIYIIEDGANTVSMADERTSDLQNLQIKYYFGGQ
ncbi:MAG: hypothetical protein Q9M43_05805 [Sulfurimonas sp.]|nr:hypothetical protein [Sulfurimonas sp.]